MATLPSDSDTSFLLTILWLALLVFLFMLVTVVIILRASKGRRVEPAASLDPVPTTAVAAKAPPGPELPTPMLHPQAAASTPPQGRKVLSSLMQRMQFICVPLIALLMVGLFLFPALIIGKSLELDNRILPLILLIMLVTVGGGAIGIRLARLSWRQTVLAAILSGAGIMLLSRFEFSPFYPGPWDNAEHHFHPGVFLVGSLLFSIPLFLLPLFDPALRRTGLTPSIWKVLTAAIALAGLLSLWDWLVSGDGLVVLILGIFAAACLLLVGIVSTLAMPMAAVAVELGGIGLFLAPLTVAAWVLLGGGWFT